MKSKDVVQVLREAKKLLVKTGWCKGVSVKYKKSVVVVYPDFPPPVAYCASGAIRVAEDAVNASILTGKVARRFLADTIPTSFAAFKTVPAKIASWNDYSRTTKKMVLLAFDRAIRAASKEAKKSK
jgi:hypothetical protein